MSIDINLHKELTAELRSRLSYVKVSPNDVQVRDIIEDFVFTHELTKLKSHLEKKEIIDVLFNSTRKDLDILQPLADDAEINEIMVNGIDNVFVEKKGKISKVNLTFDGVEHLEEIIRRVVSKIHREINELNPIVDARLEDGSRVNAVYKNIALDGPILTIRKFPKNRINMEMLIEKQAITVEAADFLKKLVRAGYNIFISGGTSSGKTTFLNVLSNYIPREERVIVIEDSAELQISEIDNIVRMESKNANVQGKGEVNIRSLIKASLRMRPDRIIVGEVRGGEVLDMIQAMNTGHDGSLSTGHANSPAGMINRMETMFLTAADFPIEAIRSQIAAAIDIIVHLGRLKDKSRKVLEIAEVKGYFDGQILLNTLFKYKAESEISGAGILMKTENDLIHTEKLEMA